MSVAIVIGLALGALSGIAIISNPYVGLGIFTSTLLLRPADLFPSLAGLHITRLIAALTFIVMLFRKSAQKERLLADCPQLRLLVALVMIMLFSITTSIWKGNSLNYFFNIIKVLIGFLLIINLVNSVKRLKGIIWVMAISGLVMGLFAIKSHAGGENLAAGYRVQGFIGGMFSNPNDLALYFVLLIPLSIYLLARTRSMFVKLFSLSCCAVFLTGAIFTYSRGGALGLLAVVLLLFLRSRSKGKAIITMAILVVLFFSFAPTKYIGRIKTIPSSPKEDVNTISRLDAWEAGMKMMTQRFFGVGIGNFGEGFVIYRPDDAIDVPGMRRAAHNSFIQIGGETGILGLIIFLLLIYVTLKSLNQTRNISSKLTTAESKEITALADTIFISMMGFLVCVFFLSQAYNWIFYYLIGFSVVLRGLVKRKSYVQAYKQATA